MKKIKVNISMLFLLAGFYVQAQNIAIGLRGGISIPNLSASRFGNNQPASIGMNLQFGFTFN